MTSTQAVAVPIPIATLPVFQHLFIIKERICCGCYEEIFTIKKNSQNWVVKRRCDEKQFLIPILKPAEDIIHILIMLSLDRSNYKIELI